MGKGLGPENARSFVVGAYNSPCDSFLRLSVVQTSVNLSQAALSLSDFWLSDHTQNYVSTYRIFALALYEIKFNSLGMKTLFYFIKD